MVWNFAAAGGQDCTSKLKVGFRRLEMFGICLESSGPATGQLSIASPKIFIDDSIQYRD